MDYKKGVSVLTITYGHESYIAETIEGVLNQDADFPIEMIIADDHSPDETEKVVRFYIENHPNGHRIKYTKHTVNKGMNHNYIWALEQCQKKYIAVCEGDDFWTDPNKLQCQVDFLEKNKTFSFTFHQVNRVNQKGQTLVKNYSPANFFAPESFFSSERVITYDMVINTCSLLFRNNEQLSRQMEGAIFLPFGDKIIEKLLALQGDGYLFRNSMACYRANPNSVTREASWRNYGKENRYHDYIELFKYLKGLTKSDVKLELLDKVIKRCKHRLKNNEFLWYFSPNSISIIYIYSGRRISNFFKLYLEELYQSFKRFILKRVLKRF